MEVGWIPFWSSLSEMEVGWIPFWSSLSAASSRLPAITQTEVVPSPASISCALLSSTSILAAGWTTFISLRMVAPSLVMVTSPLASWIILSMPRGPRLVLMASLRALAAWMLELLISSGFEFLDFISPWPEPDLDAGPLPAAVMVPGVFVMSLVEVNQAIL